MATPVKLRHIDFLSLRSLGMRSLLTCKWLLHWLVFLITPALGLITFAPLVIVISVKALLLSKKKLTGDCPHCGKSLLVPFTCSEANSSLEEMS